MSFDSSVLAACGKAGTGVIETMCGADDAGGEGAVWGGAMRPNICSIDCWRKAWRSVCNWAEMSLICSWFFWVTSWGTWIDPLKKAEQSTWGQCTGQELTAVAGLSWVDLGSGTEMLFRGIMLVTSAVEPECSSSRSSKVSSTQERFLAVNTGLSVSCSSKSPCDF